MGVLSLSSQLAIAANGGSSHRQELNSKAEYGVCFVGVASGSCLGEFVFVFAIRRSRFCCCLVVCLFLFLFLFTSFVVWLFVSMGPGSRLAPRGTSLCLSVSLGIFLRSFCILGGL